MLFLAIKGAKYGREFTAAVTSASRPFLGFYFALTGGTRCTSPPAF